MSLTERLLHDKNAGYSILELAHMHELTEDEVRTLLKIDNSKLKAAVEINKAAEDSSLTVAEAQQRIKDKIRDELNVTENDMILNHWFSLNNEEKVALVKRALP